MTGGRDGRVDGTVSEVVGSETEVVDSVFEVVDSVSEVVGSGAVVVVDDGLGGGGKHPSVGRPTEKFENIR